MTELLPSCDKGTKGGVTLCLDVLGVGNEEDEYRECETIRKKLCATESTHPNQS